jgi:hypothetical protein
MMLGQITDDREWGLVGAGTTGVHQETGVRPTNGDGLDLSMARIGL